MSTNTVTVYSRPGCVQCNATYRSLDKAGIDYTVDDAMKKENHELILSLDLMQAPAILVRDGEKIIDFWSGFRPDKIKEIENNEATPRKEDGQKAPAMSA